MSKLALEAVWRAISVSPNDLVNSRAPELNGSRRVVQAGKRSVDCLFRVSEMVYSHHHVFDADIESFFDRVVRRKLVDLLKSKS